MSGPERISPSFEQLIEAYAARRRSDWPLTLDATLRDPVLGGIVRSEAIRRILASRRAAMALHQGSAMHPHQGGPMHPHHAAPMGLSTRPLLGAHPTVDLKRRAAGDTDED